MSASDEERLRKIKEGLEDRAEEITKILKRREAVRQDVAGMEEDCCASGWGSCAPKPCSSYGRASRYYRSNSQN